MYGSVWLCLGNVWLRYVLHFVDIPEQADPPSNERRISIISPDIPADADPLA